MIDELLKKQYVKNNSQIFFKLNELKADIQKNFYNVVVVGEFNRGKSTFINALLGKSLLPTDILPETATINAIIFNEEPKLSIMTTTGEKSGEPDLEFLKKFSAQILDEKSAAQVKYIKIGYPIELLKNRIVLIDTPGVFDLSEQRTEITYSFIPKADTVIFLLDAGSPLKKSEYEFICEHLIPFGITDILFLLNKYDRIDEDEEEDLVERVKRRLEKAFKDNDQINNIECLPVSALNAIKGIESGNLAMVKSSGINEVKQKLKEMLTQSRMEELKKKAFQRRLNSILEILHIQIENLYAIKISDSASLKNTVEKLNEMLEEKTKLKYGIEKYSDANKQIIYEMTDKSINFFHVKLKEEICELIENYNQDNFKNFIEKTVTKAVKKNFETWINTYSPAVDRLLSELEKEIARGLSRNFNQNIKLASGKNVSLKAENFAVPLDSEDISNINVKVGVIAAAGSLSLMAILGGGILPFIGFAALPYLRQKFLTEKLNQVKAEVIPQVEIRLEELTRQLKNTLHSYTDQRCEVIVQNAEYAYEKLLEDLRMNIQAEISAKNQIGSNIKNETATLKSALEEITTIQKSI